MQDLLITPEELKQLLEEDAVVLIDVRNPEEYEEASIPGSILIPKDELIHADLTRFKDKKIVFHCQAGRRSYASCVISQDTCPQARTLDGGLNAWSAKGYPVNRRGDD